MPFYQSALGDRLEYELKFNEFRRVIQATCDVDASYHIGGISLEYDMGTLPELENQPKRARRSMKGILMLFENVAAQQPFARNTEAFYNPQITKVEVTIEGIPNQLYSQGMRAYQMWDEAKKYLSAIPGSKQKAAKDIALADVTLGEFVTSKYSLWIDLRTSDDAPA